MAIEGESITLGDTIADGRGPVAAYEVEEMRPSSPRRSTTPERRRSS
ncbi:MAG: hypothetical protein R2699_10110 [Acidimicrobiales bacterium]